jgi:hypothetical protein
VHHRAELLGAHVDVDEKTLRSPRRLVVAVCRGKRDRFEARGVNLRDHNTGLRQGAHCFLEGRESVPGFKKKCSIPCAPSKSSRCSATVEGTKPTSTAPPPAGLGHKASCATTLRHQGFAIQFPRCGSATPGSPPATNTPRPNTTPSGPEVQQHCGTVSDKPTGSHRHPRIRRSDAAFRVR